MMKHLNFNSLLSAAVIVMLKFALGKLDEINTSNINLRAAQVATVERLDRIEKDMVMRAEFRSEIDRLEQKIAKATH